MKYLCTTFAFQLIIQSSLTRYTQMRLGPCAWIIISPFPPFSSGSQHRCTRGGPIPRPKIRRASKMTGWSERRSTSSTASAAYLSPARSHSADRKGRTTEFRRCYPNCNNEGASRLWWWYIYGGEVAQSSWKCNKEQGIASRVDSGGSWKLRCTLDCLNVVHCDGIVEELV